MALLAGWSLLWLTEVASGQDLGGLAKQKPVTFSGSLNITTDVYRNVTGRERLDPFAWTVSGSPTLSVYGISVPVFFLINNQSRSLTGPFHQFGMSPYYKWVKVHAGYRNLTFSPYTLAGRLFLGAGVELTPGKLRFAAMYGQFEKARPADPLRFTALDAPAPLPTFRRTGYAIKLGFGTASNYVDLIYFRAKDNINSISFPAATRITPDENAVIGLSSQLTFFKRLTWTTNLGVSAYSRDIRRPENTEITTQYPFLQRFFVTRSGTQVAYAGESSLNFSSSIFTMQLQLRQISAEYQSMGAYFFNNDLREITVSPSLVLMQGKVQIGGSYGYQQDNVSKLRPTTTTRKIGSANVSFQPNQVFSLMMNYSNYGTAQNSPTRIIDTLKIQQVNQSFVLAPRLFFNGDNQQHTFSAFITYQKSNDFNTVSQVRTDFNNVMANLNYSFGRPKERLTLTPGLSAIRNYIPGYNTQSVGASFVAAKGFNKGKLNSTLSSTYYQNFYEGTTNGYSLRFRASGRYRPAGPHEFSLSVASTINQDKVVKSRNFTELFGQVGYNLAF
jgi:hypothetical protein